MFLTVMCTISLVPDGDDVRVMFNRDERRTRAAATPPRIHRVGSRDAIYPVDPESGGTWVGVNDAGVVLALLNATDSTASADLQPRFSRGLVVPGLLGFAVFEEVAAAAAAIDVAWFAPFRLVILQGSRVAVATALRTEMTVAFRELAAPLLVTSSSLGDARVTGPRQRLFERLVVRGPSGWLEGQSRLHRHRWPGRPEISVRMEREDALTVSLTTIRVGTRLCTVSYEAPVAGRAPGEHHRCSLQR